MTFLNALAIAACWMAGLIWFLCVNVRAALEWFSCLEDNHLPGMAFWVVVEVVGLAVLLWFTAQCLERLAP